MNVQIPTTFGFDNTRKSGIRLFEILLKFTKSATLLGNCSGLGVFSTPAFIILELSWTRTCFMG